MTSGAPDSLPKSFIRLWLALLIIAAFFIRVHGANDWYYSPDESMHANISDGANLKEVLRFSHYEIHPPALYILTHYWMAFSHDPAFVRSLSLVLGIALILIYYLIGKTLSGEMTGLMCALLVAFGNGCIIQSYVVRQYMVFLVFISLCFYCYLHWQNSRTTRLLLAYGAFAILACLTHFSAVFSLFCIGSAEMLRMLRRKATLRDMLPWVGINGLALLIALYAYSLWQPILVPLKFYFASRLSGPLPDRLIHALLYPLAAPGYILGYGPALALLFCLAWFACAPPRFATDAKGLRAAIGLNAFAYALGMLLAITRIYPEPGLRHSLWVLPFVIPPAGWMLADICRGLAPSLPTRYPLPLIAMLLLALGWLSYSPQTRFGDGSEYAMPQAQWAALNASLGQLGPNDVIVTDKDDGIMLTNLYRYMGADAFTGKAMAKLAPWRNTTLIFNPYFPRYYSTDIFLATLEQAKERHWLDKTGSIVFLRLAWSRSPVTDLMLCPELGKRIAAFPPFPPGHELTRMDIYRSYAAAMTLSKQALDDVLSPGSKAHACLSRANDQVPQAEPPAR